MITPSGSLALCDGTLAIVDAHRLPDLQGWPWRPVRGKYPGRNVWVDRKQTTVYLARAITDAQPGQVVRPRNGNPRDCRLANLEVLPGRSAHMARTMTGLHRDPSAGPRGASGYKGVSFHIRTWRWQASITLPVAPGRPARQRHLGCYATAEEAARAYDRAAREIHGEAAYQNLPAGE